MVIAAFSITALLQWVGDNWQAILIAIGMVIAAASVLIKALEVLVAILVKFFPKLSVLDGDLKGIAAWLDALAKSGFLNRAALSPAAAKAPGGPVAPPGWPVGLKGLAILVAAGLCLHSTPARASGFEWSVGPSVSAFGFEPGAVHPFQIAPGGGVQFSLTHEAFQKLMGGHVWDLLSLSALAFGQLVADGPKEFGAFSVGAMVTTMSSLIGVGVAWRVVTSDQELATGRPIILMALSFNFGLSPTPSGLGVGMPTLRGNTIYF